MSLHDPLKVEIIYRRYKPLHQLYYSFTKQAPEGIEYIIPKHIKSLNRLLPIYRIFGDISFIKGLIRLVQKRIFDTSTKNLTEKVDLYHFTQMLPEKEIDKPYVVDFEHIAALGNFVEMDEYTKERILHKLLSKQCKKVMPLSEAAKGTLENFVGEEYYRIRDKVEVVYPALPNFFKMYKNKIDNSFIPNDSTYLNLLFVGNDVYRKGLHELLEAVSRIKNNKIRLYIVSNIPQDLKKKYSENNFIYLKPQFTKEEIIKKLFIPADVFVMPTHGDSFGMVYLDSLSSGTPVITTNQFAIPEFIKDRENGLFVHSERLYFEKFDISSRKTSKGFHTDVYEELLIKELVQQIKMINKNRGLIKKMSFNAPKIFESGNKFSIEERNKKLSRIYRKAMK